jgi:thioredoxin reductase (NADPH)
MVRSILLRGFDQGMASKIGSYMENHGIKFAHQCIPTKFSKLDNGRTLVEYHDLQNKQVNSEEFDTCLLAIGRTADTYNIGVEQIGLKTSKSGKILVDEFERSNVDGIYAIGDCAESRPELTPPAIMAGRLIAKRLFGNYKAPMDYINIATTVFTPIEYGAVGLSEEDALKK